MNFKRNWLKFLMGAALTAPLFITSCASEPSLHNEMAAEMGAAPDSEGNKASDSGKDALEGTTATTEDASAPEQLASKAEPNDSVAKTDLANVASNEGADKKATDPITDLKDASKEAVPPVANTDDAAAIAPVASAIPEDPKKETTEVAVDAPKGPEAILPAPEKSAAVNSVPETATLESPAPTPETATTQFNTDSIPNAPVMADAQKTEAPAPLLAMSQTDSENANIDPAAAPEIVKPVSVKKVHHHQTHTRKLASTTPVVDSQPAPVVPTQPVTVAGKTLNRYYFVRQGDTAEAISNRLYGNLQKLTDLIAWNGNQVTWKPGKVILYLSASNPEDVTMQSYFDEQSLGAEPYTLHKGETLEKLAQARYGNGASWGEIAVLNKIADLSHAKNGQHLRLFPASLPLKPLVEPIASTEIPVVVAKPAPEVMPTPVPRAPVEKPALANPEVTSVFGSHHLGVAALLAAASVLMFAFFLVRRRKSRADHSDF